MSDDNLFGQEHVEAYRATDGERGFHWRGARCLLLTTGTPQHPARQRRTDRQIPVVVLERV